MDIDLGLGVCMSLYKMVDVSGGNDIDADELKMMLFPHIYRKEQARGQCRVRVPYGGTVSSHRAQRT